MLGRGCHEQPPIKTLGAVSTELPWLTHFTCAVTNLMWPVWLHLRRTPGSCPVSSRLCPSPCSFADFAVWPFTTKSKALSTTICWVLSSLGESPNLGGLEKPYTTRLWKYAGKRRGHHSGGIWLECSVGQVQHEWDLLYLPLLILSCPTSSSQESVRAEYFCECSQLIHVQGMEGRVGNSLAHGPGTKFRWESGPG